MRGSPYLQLVRPANVVTALADVLAGYAVAGRPGKTELVALLVATACLYAGGVVLNDYFDRDLDRVERPERPIPSGRVAPGAAAALGGCLLAAGILAALAASETAGAVGALTAAAILLYDSWGKRQPLLGPVNMGLCRGLNLMLGVAATPAALGSAWYLAILPVAYITAVTAV
ncbi:MAG TPA: UbiA family prenyltransferase, partial [Vicinamibacterales bacterium]|nr:UbiA family prenyltransferase [Vicinamibacterales bacterium]